MFLNTKIDISKISNQNYSLVLALFNGAILMNFHTLIMKNHLLLSMIILLVTITIIDFKYWWATIANSIISIYLLITEFPRIGNHATLILVISLLLVAIYLLKTFSIKTKLKSTFLPYLFRTVLATIYFYAGFHKLNTAFFNSCVSCVNEINSYILSNFINSSTNLTVSWSTVFQYATIILEMIVPFGLFWHKTRKYAAFILLLFHFYLSFSVFADFCSLALFLIIGCLHDFDAKTIHQKVKNALKIYLLFAILAIVSQYFMSYLYIIKYPMHFYKGIIYNIGFLYFVVVYFQNYNTPKNHFQRNYTYYLIPIFILISIWTLKTYVGLGNMGNLTMFSNLVTEKSKSNHFLIDTKKTKVFDFEEDYVEIINLNNSNARETFVGFRIPLVEFKYMIQNSAKKSNKPLPCTLRYKNKLLIIEDLKKSEFNTAKWWYKYLSFRKIQIKGANECRW